MSEVCLKPNTSSSATKTSQDTKLSTVLSNSFDVGDGNSSETDRLLGNESKSKQFPKVSGSKKKTRNKFFPVRTFSGGEEQTLSRPKFPRHPEPTLNNLRSGFRPQSHPHLATQFISSNSFQTLPSLKFSPPPLFESGSAMETFLNEPCQPSSAIGETMNVPKRTTCNLSSLSATSLVRKDQTELLTDPDKQQLLFNRCHSDETGNKSVASPVSIQPLLFSTPAPSTSISASYQTSSLHQPGVDVQVKFSTENPLSEMSTQAGDQTTFSNFSFYSAIPSSVSNVLAPPTLTFSHASTKFSASTDYYFRQQSSSSSASSASRQPSAQQQARFVRQDAVTFSMPPPLFGPNYAAASQDSNNAGLQHAATTSSFNNSTNTSFSNNSSFNNSLCYDEDKTNNPSNVGHQPLSSKQRNHLFAAQHNKFNNNNVSIDFLKVRTENLKANSQLYKFITIDYFHFYE